jgi:hypothetical protein
LLRARPVQKGQEDTATVALEPVQVECLRCAEQFETLGAEAGERDRLAAARTDRDRLRGRGLNGREGSEGKVVGEESEVGGASPSGDCECSAKVTHRRRKRFMRRSKVAADEHTTRR